MDLRQQIPGNFLGNKAWKTFLQDIQTNIVRPHQKSEIRYIFLRFTHQKDIHKIKSWISVFSKTNISNAYDLLLDSVFSREAEKKVLTACILFISEAGLKFLALKSIGETYNENYQAPAKDPFAEFKNDMEDWCKSDQMPHLMIQISSNHEHIELLNDFFDTRIKNTLEKDKIAFSVHLEHGRLIKTDFGDACSKLSEPFGYRDCISQPEFFLKRRNALSSSEWAPDADLDLVFFENKGLKEEKSYVFSTAAYLKIEQHIAAFNNNIAKIKSKLEDDDLCDQEKVELAEAYLIGRFKDGTPVMKSNKKMGDHASINDFNYPKDIHKPGNKCPFIAHIHKANPRNDRNIRIVRRGAPYTINKGSIEEKGLHFLSYQKDIESIFKPIFKDWMPREIRPGGGKNDGNDTLFWNTPINGPGMIPKKWGKSDPDNIDDFFSLKEIGYQKPTSIKGMIFFLVPSISFLKDLSKL